MDHETGEMLTQIFYPEDKNGEIISCVVDDETGEEVTKTLFQSEQSRFRIPLYFYKKFDEDYYQQRKSSVNFYTNDYTSCILFLLPSVLVFTYPAIACLFAILEVMLHMKTHSVNNFLQPDRFVFHSPLHVLTSQFCFFCRTENCAEKFTALNKQSSDTKKWYSVIS